MRSADTLLQRPSDVRVHLDSTNSARVEWSGGLFRGGPHTLALLEAFRRPRTLAEALRDLRLAGPADWAEAARTAREMVRQGLLAPPGGPGADRSGFGHPRLHVRMLTDLARTGAFLRALEQAVRPGDVVLDLGAGTGILSVAAARAGARKVYAVEAGEAARVARRVVAANGCADRVEVLREWSYRVELPERADVVVSETLGSDPLEEGMLPSLADARRRLARPGARFLPGRVEILALPVEVPDDEGTRLLARANLAGWQERYGFDLGAVAEWQEASPGRQAALPVERARRFRALGPAVPLADFQPGEEESPPLEGICPWPPEAGALLVAFRAFLGPGNALSTVPDEAGDTHWALPLYLATGEGPRLRWSLAPGAERFERVAGSPGGPGPA